MPRQGALADWLPINRSPSKYVSQESNVVAPLRLNGSTISLLDTVLKRLKQCSSSSIYLLLHHLAAFPSTPGIIIIYCLILMEAKSHVSVNDEMPVEIPPIPQSHGIEAFKDIVFGSVRNLLFCPCLFFFLFSF